jgi:uncharacterized protein with HEPN domain
MQNKISDNIRVQHILDAIQEIENYIEGVDLEIFLNNSMMFNATLRQLEIIGEAANGLTENFLQNTQEIPWARIIGLRNLIIHEYFGIDDITIWNIVKINLPDLKQKLVSQ